MAGQAFRKFLLLFDRVFVERIATTTVTKGGIMLPEKSQGKVLQAKGVAVGSGSKGKGGEIQPVSMRVGDKFLLLEYGGTRVVLDDKDYFLFRDGDILTGHCGSRLSSQHFGRPRWADHLKSGVRAQPGQRGETPSLLKIQKLAGRGGVCL
ncbi:10 kDa heat shock protein, mitochondrial-like [Pan paniscus]|uniref:10 kDa heat shock protein, mitochondrial-like n=1 Tax=Pan paniscus TaxID=9597 RepID=UPI002436F3B9|nr:10 kDa heat shock protein, mitochondrial-like [Pan paniscus]